MSTSSSPEEAPGAVARASREPLDELAHYSLRLFVIGATISSARAIRNVQELCEKHLRGHYELTVVDVRRDGGLSARDRVLATPTLVRQSPPPELIRVGDFSDHESVLTTLGIWATSDD